MPSKVGFEELKFSCVIGDLPHERENEQEITVSLSVEVNLSDCLKSDCLSDTVDYVSLADLCQKIAKEGRFQMLECYAGAVLKTLFLEQRIEKAKFCVKKPAMFMGAKWAFVEIEQCRSEY
ncbi:MAG: dihydroneopterin aldolase [Waddliaceae bacterium]